MFTNFFSWVNAIHSQQTRRRENNLFFLLRFSKPRTQRSVKFQGVKVRNTIPSEYKKLSLKKNFKTKTKNII